MKKRNGKPIIKIINSRGIMSIFELSEFGKEKISIGRNAEQNDITIRDKFVSSVHGFFICREGQWYYRDNQSTNGSLAETAGNRIKLYRSKMEFLLNSGASITITNPEDSSQPVKIIFEIADSDSVIKCVPVSSGKSIFIGRREECDICLKHPSVSRQHAIVEKRGSSVILQVKGTNGAIVNGRRIVSETTLKNRDIIQILGFELIYTNEAIYFSAVSDGISISVNNVNKWVGKGKNKKQILKNVSIEIGKNEFVAIIGGSGAGKSTIMNAVNGFDKDFSGNVSYNGSSITENFNHLKDIIGYVPQDDIIYENLTLQKMLEYTAQLRMAKDSDKTERQKRIAEVLKTIDLTEHKNTLIRKLSGGQKKRASIAVELLADPKVFFLDEPTSGLDPGTEKNLMVSMKKLCKEQSRTIIMVTHTTQSLHLCDKIIFMGGGGRVCFVGSEAEAKRFFECDNLTEIYNLIAARPEHWEKKYRNINSNSDEIRETAGKVRNKSKISIIRQFAVITKRYIELTYKDIKKFIISILEPVIIGLLLCIVAKPEVFQYFSATKPILFTLSCAAIWIGLFNSIQEICKERSILKREYMAGLNLLVYILSKIIVQIMLALIQAVLLTLTFMLFAVQLKDGAEIKAEDMIFGSINTEIILTVWITIIASAALGLIVSSIVKSGDKAMTVAPFILIVQLLFSGILFKLEDASEYISYVTISRSSVGALGKIANLNILTEAHGMQPATEKMFDWSAKGLLTDWGIMLGMIVVSLAVSVVMLRRVAKDGR